MDETITVKSEMVGIAFEGYCQLMRCKAKATNIIVLVVNGKVGLLGAVCKDHLKRAQDDLPMIAKCIALHQAERVEGM